MTSTYNQYKWYGLRIECILKRYCYLQIFNNKILSMKILNTSLGFGKPMTERYLENFLDKNILRYTSEH